MAEKSTFLQNFHFFGLGLYWAGSQYRGKYLCIFGRGAKKVEKNRKNHEKIENFRFFKIDPKVKIWSYGGQFWPKN